MTASELKPKVVDVKSVKDEVHTLLEAEVKMEVSTFFGFIYLE